MTEASSPGDWYFAEECIVCFGEKPDVRLVPCSHVCLCAGCSAKHTIRTCPLCRQKITKKEKVSLEELRKVKVVRKPLRELASDLLHQTIYDKGRMFSIVFLLFLLNFWVVATVVDTLLSPVLGYLLSDWQRVGLKVFFLYSQAAGWKANDFRLEEIHHKADIMDTEFHIKWTGKPRIVKSLVRMLRQFFLVFSLVICDMMGIGIFWSFLYTIPGQFLLIACMHPDLVKDFMSNILDAVLTPFLNPKAVCHWLMTFRPNSHVIEPVSEWCRDVGQQVAQASQIRSD